MKPPWMLADYCTKGSYPTERVGGLTGDQQTHKLKGIMSLISTLTLPTPSTLRKTNHHNNLCPPCKQSVCQRENPKQRDCSRLHSPLHTIKFIFKGSRGSVVWPSGVYGLLRGGLQGGFFESIWSTENCQIIPQVLCTSEMKRKIPNPVPSPTEDFRGSYFD